MDQIDRNGLHQDVEIVVSDNCSTDGTEAYMQSLLAQQTCRIVYNRNPQNLGVIQNILKLVEFSSGSYWMFYGDDDIIPGNQLLLLVNTFRNHPQQNAFMFRWEADSFCQDLSDGVVLTPGELAKDFFYYIGNAGIFALKTVYAKKVVEAYRPDLLDTCWPQTMMMFMGMYAFERPGIKYIDLISSETPEIAVIRSNSYYLFETALYALIRTALHIEQRAQVPFIEFAKHSIDGIKYFDAHRQIIIENYLYYDSEKQKHDFAESVKKAHREIPEKYRHEIEVYYRFVKSWKFLYMLRHYIRYVKDSMKRNIQTSFVNRIKIYSPYGYYSSIRQVRREQASLKQMLKREEVSAESGYF